MKNSIKKYSVVMFAIGVLSLLAFLWTVPTETYGGIVKLSPWYTVHSNRQRTKYAYVRGVLEPVERFHLVDDGNENPVFGVSVISSPSTFPDGIARYYRLVNIEDQELSYLQVINTQTGEVEYTLNDVNSGARITIPTVLSNGNVIVPDGSRIRLYTHDFYRRIWIRYLRDRNTPVEEPPMWNTPVYGADELPDGKLLVPTGGGMIYILGRRFGRVTSKFDLKSLGVKMDPIDQTYLRCGPAYDGNLVFVIVYEEILLFKYVPIVGLVLQDRYHYGDNQLSSTTPCIDREGERVFFSSVPYDSPETPAFQYALSYENREFSLRWSYSGPEVQPGHPDIKDQASNAYNKTNGLIIFNSNRGISVAFQEEICGDSFCPKIVWQTPHGGNYLSAVAGIDNIFYSTDMDNQILYALNGDTGETIWTMPIPDRSFKPIVISDGIIYYDHPNGLLAIEQKDVRVPSLAKERKNFFNQRRAAPNYTVLLQNHPNPFNPETWLPFQLAEDALVTISIYNTQGRLVRTLSLAHRSAGIYATKGKSAYWDGRDNSGQKVASGVYFYTLQSGTFTATRRMVITK